MASYSLYGTSISILIERLFGNSAGSEIEGDHIIILIPNLLYLFYYVYWNTPNPLMISSVISIVVVSIRSVLLQCPVLIEDMIHSSEYAERVGPTCIEALDLLLKRPWDPMTALSNRAKMVGLLLSAELHCWLSND